MKSRTVIFLWIIVIALAASIFLIKRSQGSGQEKATARTPGQTLIEDFPAEEVANIEISGTDGSVSLVEKDGKWTVSERDDYPAEVSNINDLLRTLSEIKITQAIDAGPSFAARFGMDESSSLAADRGITAVFKDSSGKELANLTFGKNLDAASSQSQFGGGVTGRYVRDHADDSGFYAVSEAFGTVSPYPKDWLSDEFLKVEKIKTISLTKPGSEENEWTLTREEEDGDFMFTDAFPGVKIDPDVTGQLKTLFAYARFEDIVPASEVEKRKTPDQLQTAVITTFEALEYTVAMQPAKPVDGAKEGTPKTYLMTISAAGDFPETRKKAGDEKDEEAQKAEAAFTERLTALKDALAKTKAFEGRTFEVSSIAVAALLKSRTDLMLKTPAPTAPTGGSAFTQPLEIPAQLAPAPQPQAPAEE